MKVAEDKVKEAVADVALALMHACRSEFLEVGDR